jgi:predicted transcriptional regulator
MATTATSIKLDPELKERIVRLAEAQQRSAHWLMKQAIEEFVDRAEKRRKFDEESRAAIEEYDATGLHLSHDEVMTWLERRARGEVVPLPELHK